MSSRFDYVKYDEQATTKQSNLKAIFEQLEQLVETTLPEGRAKSIVMTYLEIAYMWTGKAIRDEQLSRNLNNEFPPERTNV